MILKAFLFIKKYWHVVIAITIFSLIATVYLQRDKIKSQAEEIVRKDKNIENLTKKGDTEITVTHKEYETISTPAKTKIDSVKKVAKISSKQVKSATVETITFKDTVKREAKHETPQEIAPPKPMSVKFYKIPVKEELECWGMGGYILTSDSNAKLVITSRMSGNSIQRLDISNRFLGFLWITKKSTFRAFNDCGEVKIDKINFIKK